MKIKKMPLKHKDTKPHKELTIRMLSFCNSPYLPVRQAKLSVFMAKSTFRE
jgi:hypothetical protein